MFDKPFLIAHRGASRLAPENTMAALQEALRLGAKWVEFDVMCCKGGEAIVMHDTTLKRTTNGNGAVIDFTFEELSKLSAGHWFSPEFAQEKIPRFADVILFLKENKMSAVVELKPVLGYEIETAQKAVHLLQHHWPDFHEHIVVSSFSHSALEEARRCNKNVMIGVSTEVFSNDLLTFAASLNAMSIHIDFLALTPEICQKINAARLDIFSYTVNDTSVANNLFNWGVKAVFTDVPDELGKIQMEF